MGWSTLARDGAVLHGRDEGTGLPVIFQHGLGGDEAQVAEVFPDGGGFRRLTLECRGQGRSASGDPAALSIASFADDVLAFADACGAERFAIGGISMGAAIALRLAALHPERVVALILVRPAWLWQAAPANMRMFSEIAGHLRNPNPGQALLDFESSATARELSRDAPDNLVSMRRFLAAPDRERLAALLLAIASDGPGVSEAQVRSIGIPTLVIGTRVDIAHPLAFARQFASTIPNSQLIEITPKSVDRTRYVAEFRAALSKFLSGLAHSKGPPS